MKKIFVLITIMLVLSGCTIQYDVSFSSNGFVNDNAYIEELVDSFSETEPDDWNILLGSRISDISIKNEFFEEIATYQISLKGNYDGYDTYFNDEYVKKYIGDLSIDEGDDECTLLVKFNDAFTYNVYGSDDIPSYVDDLKINLSFPYNIIKTNATTNNDGELTWELSSNNKLDSIYITYENPNKKESVNKTAFDVLIVIIIVLAIVFIISIASKNKKNNAL